MIEGLEYIGNFIDKDEENFLIQNIEDGEWSMIGGRKVQQYGYTYDYFKKTLKYASPIPLFLKDLKDRIEKEANFIFDQVIINKYEPGQGISSHIDHPTLFKECIISLSLQSNIDMDFKLNSHCKTLRLRRRSLLVLKSDARWKWQHSIAQRKTDGDKERGTRISITMRKT